MIYFIRARGTDLVKIGFTAGDPAVRLAALQVGCPHELVLEATVAGGAVLDERRIHGWLADCAVRGEWFALSLERVQRVVADEAARARDLSVMLDALAVLRRRATWPACDCPHSRECSRCITTLHRCRLCDELVNEYDEAIDEHDGACAYRRQVSVARSLGFSDTELGFEEAPA